MRIAENDGVNCDVTSAEPQRQGAVYVDYYTDPLCSWSWGFEPQWRQLRYEFGPQLQWRYRMGGLLPNWQNYSDDVTSISRAGQMGPQWVQVQRLTRMPLASRLWAEDPPSTSYPACLLVKAAQRHSPQAGEAVLRALREALMIDSRNIARLEVLRDVVLEAVAAWPQLGLDAGKLWEDFHCSHTRADFREDLKDAAYHGITRFPTLVIRHGASRPLVLVGCRSYQDLRASFSRVAATARPRRTVALTAYAAYWQRITLAELAAALNQSSEKVCAELANAIAIGELDSSAVELLGESL